MGFQFPQQEDIQLSNSPLVEVVCQIRFPAILKITSREPVAFQEEIRSHFPHYEVEQGISIRFPVAGSEGTHSPEVQPKVFWFRSEDKRSGISLAADFFAVSTTKYENWEAFAYTLITAANTVRRIYSPTQSSRIGLRYINRFTLNNTRSSDYKELLRVLRPELTTLFHVDAWSQPEGLVTQVSLSNENEHLNIRLIFGHENSQPVIVLDFDYFEEGQLSLDHLVERCKRYHSNIYNAFRWCITDEALKLFSPLNKK